MYLYQPPQEMYWEQKHPVINKDPVQDYLDSNLLISKDLGGENLDLHPLLLFLRVFEFFFFDFQTRRHFPKKQGTIFTL